MARRRVFRARLKGADTLEPPYHDGRLNGCEVTLEKLSDSEVKVNLGGSIVARFAGMLGAQIASALDRGQAFTATIEKAFPIYDDKFKATGASLDVKVEYLLDKGQPAIEPPNASSSGECLCEPRKARSFFTKVAGVTHEGRQQVVAQCSAGERLVLVRDPNNPFDEGAIKIMRSNGQQIGFIPAHVSRSGDSGGLSAQMDRGNRFQCRIKDLTGGWGGRSLGVNIEITEDLDFASPEIAPLRKEAPTYRVIRNRASHPSWLLWCAAVAVLIIIGLIFLK